MEKENSSIHDLGNELTLSNTFESSSLTEDHMNTQGSYFMKKQTNQLT